MSPKPEDHTGSISPNSQLGLAAYTNEIVIAVYKAILGRNPDNATLTSYAAEFTKTGDISDVVSSIAGSKEAWERNLYQRPEELVRIAYVSLLGREPDPSGLDTHSQSLRKTRDYANLLSRLCRSVEHQQKCIKFNTRQFAAKDLLESKLVFLHIPKTGGTTLHEILRGAFEKGEICPERFNGLRHYPAGELARYRFFSGHFDLPSVKLIPGCKKVITMLRDPVERLISLYFFQRAHRPEIIAKNKLELARLANKYTMLDFFRAKEIRNHPSINNAMTRMLVDTVENERWEFAAAEHGGNFAATMPFLELAVRELEALDSFGILERYDDSVELICQSVGLQIPSQIPLRQVLDVIVDTVPGLHRIDKEPVTEEIRAEIESLVGTDIELYRQACKIFENRFSLFTLRNSAPPTS